MESFNYILDIIPVCYKVGDAGMKKVKSTASEKSNQRTGCIIRMELQQVPWMGNAGDCLFLRSSLLYLLTPLHLSHGIHPEC
jgi:hypothetical protein